jgi:hypothetical protein
MMHWQLALSALIPPEAPGMITQSMQTPESVKMELEVISQSQVLVVEFHLYPGRHEHAFRRGY